VEIGGYSILRLLEEWSVKLGKRAALEQASFYFFVFLGRQAGSQQTFFAA